MSWLSNALKSFTGGGEQQQQPQQSGAQYYDSFNPGQQQVNDLLAQILSQGGAPYTGQRVAPLTPGEANVQAGTQKALASYLPAITKILSGQWGPDQESYFNQAVADPMRRQFNERVAPVIRENSALTGNRFADRSAIELGQARGDVESSITQQRGQAAMDNYYAPAKYGSAITSALTGFGNIAGLERQVQQQQLDSQFEEFMRTNPQAGGQLNAMLSYLTNVKQFGIDLPNSESTVGRSSSPTINSSFTDIAANVGRSLLPYLAGAVI